MADISNRDLDYLKESLDTINNNLSAIGRNSGLSSLGKELKGLVQTLNYIPTVRHAISTELQALITNNEAVANIVKTENNEYTKLRENIDALNDAEGNTENNASGIRSNIRISKSNGFDLKSLGDNRINDGRKDNRRLSDIRKDVMALNSVWNGIKKSPRYLLTKGLGDEEIIKEIEDIRKARNSLLGEIKELAGRDIAEKSYNRIIKLTKKFFDGAKQDYKKAFKEAKDSITEITKYDLGSSVLVSQKARQQALSLGLSNSQNYAYTQAQKLMGITGLEDFYWMNNNQRAMFNEIMQREEARYREMNSNGSLVGFQRVELEQKLLREEFKASIVKFISDNQDTIINFMRTGLNFMQGMMNVVNWIFKAFSTIADALQFDRQTDWFAGLFDNGTNYSANTSYTNSNKTYNISVHNTISGNGSSQDLADKISNSNLVALSNFFNS